MKVIVAYQMQYFGGKIDSDLQVVNYLDRYYERYKSIYNACFREMRLALGLSPNCCGTGEQLFEKRNDIYLLIENGDIAGSVTLDGNEIDGLIVNPEYRGKGYGKKLLLCAVARLQSRGNEPICLHVAAWNERAVEFYKKNGFRCIKTETVSSKEQPV